MQHSLTTEGYGVRLRPVHLEDSSFIVWLRNLNHAKGRLNRSAPDIETQAHWLNAYFEREGDYSRAPRRAGGVCRSLRELI